MKSSFVQKYNGLVGVVAIKSGLLRGSSFSCVARHDAGAVNER